MCTGSLGSASQASNDYVGNMEAAFFSYHFVGFDMGVPQISYGPSNGLL